MEASFLAKSKITPGAESTQAATRTTPGRRGNQIHGRYSGTVQGYDRKLCESRPLGGLNEEHGHSKYNHHNKDTDNSRYGHSKKTLKTSHGEVDIQVPRDR